MEISIISSWIYGSGKHIKCHEFVVQDLTKCQESMLGSSVRDRRSIVWNKSGIASYGSYSNPSTSLHHVKGWQQSQKNIHVGFLFKIKKFVVSFSTPKFKSLDPTRSISMEGSVVSATFAYKSYYYVSKLIWFSVNHMWYFHHSYVHNLHS